MCRFLFVGWKMILNRKKNRFKPNKIKHITAVLLLMSFSVNIQYKYSIEFKLMSSIFKG